MSATATVPFMDLRPGADAPDVQAAIQRVIDRGWFILGPELAAFEDEFAAAMGGQYAVGVGTGTDAIALLLRALGIGPGDEVITAPVSAAYSALAIMMAGARPVFADLNPAAPTASIRRRTSARSATAARS
jgi:dTDP-4-amino-4,6-dideoxygalactose transaminase